MCCGGLGLVGVGEVCLLGGVGWMLRWCWRVMFWSVVGIMGDISVGWVKEEVVQWEMVYE